MIHKIIFVIDSSNLFYPEGKQMNEYSPIEDIKENKELPPFIVMSARYDAYKHFFEFIYQHTRY